MSEVLNLSADSTVATATREHPYARYACYAALFLSLTFFAALRFHFRNMPLERDEGEYAYMGQLVLQGVAPYKLAYTMKLPGTCLAYAAMMAVFGETPGGIRLGMIVVTTLCAILVFLLGRKLSGLLVGTVAGVTYPFLAIRPGVLGMDGHATHFVVLFALAGMLLLLRCMERERTILYFASGLSFGLSFIMKQPGILFAVFASAYWLWHEWKRGLKWNRLALAGGLFATGVVLPYALTCLWLLHEGVFGSFWFWTWSYAREYGVIMPLRDCWRLCLQWTLPWAVRPFILWEMAIAGLAAPLWSRYARPHGGFVAGLFFTSMLAVSVGLYFRPHYFIMLLPACALCIGIAVDCAQRELRCRSLGRIAAIPLLFFAVSYLASIHGQWKTYFHLDPAALSRKIHYDQAYSDAVQVADFIAARANSKDEIGIIGSEPEVCFYTRLRCASSYLYMYPLMEKQAFHKQMQSDMLDQLQSARPRFLIYEDDERAWNWSSTLEENRPFFNRAWAFAHSYDLVLHIAAPPVDASYPVHLYDSAPALYVFERN